MRFGVSVLISLMDPVNRTLVNLLIPLFPCFLVLACHLYADPRAYFLLHKYQDQRIELTQITKKPREMLKLTRY